MSRVLVVGGVNMDLHVFDVERPAGQTPRVAGPYLTEPGGKGANVARAAARLGAEVSLVGRVGDDEFGRTCVDVIAGDGVDASAVVVTPDVPTGFVAIELTMGLHRSLLFAPGANDRLTWADVEPAITELQPGDIVVAQAEVPPAVLSRLAAFVVENGVSFFLDPTPPHRVTPALIAAADVITPDRAEAAALTGRSDSSSLWPRIAARELLDAGARRVLVKLGPGGALLADHLDVVEVPTVAVEVSDETGAGDVFLAALAVKRVEGVDWADATRFANVASALSVAATGLGLPRRPAVERAVAGIVSRGGPTPGSS